MASDLLKTLLRPWHMMTCVHCWEIAWYHHSGLAIEITPEKTRVLMDCIREELGVIYTDGGGRG